MEVHKLRLVDPNNDRLLDGRSSGILQYDAGFGRRVGL